MFRQISALLLITVLASLAGSCYSQERVSYANYSVIRAIPENLKHLRALQELKNLKGDGIQFWVSPGRLNQSVDIMTSPERFSELMERLDSVDIPNRIMIADVGQQINRTLGYCSTCRHQLVDEGLDVYASGDASAHFYETYHSYEQMVKKLTSMAKDPRFTFETIGKSFEGRDLYLAKLSSDPNSQKPVILIDAGHHAREWIGHSTIFFLMESFLRGKSVNKRKAKSSNKIMKVLEEFDLWFIPVVNPDGYEYSRLHDRLWRKSRSGRGFLCKGVDLNRNYDFHWMESGASSRRCDETYAGPKPFSEPETRAVRDVMMDKSRQISLYISLHSYSQMILTPYGYGRVYTNNHKDLQRIAQAAISAISNHRGTKYTTGPSAITLYPAAGGSDDYAHGEANIKHSFTIELPDKGRHGFLLPASHIIPVGYETLGGILSMIEAL